MHCFRCGREEGSEGLVRGLCPSCYMETERPFVLDPHITVLVCASCGSVLRGKTWGDPLERDALIEHALGEHTAVKDDVEVLDRAFERGKGDERSFNLSVRVKLGVGGQEFTRSFETHLNLRRSVCDVCSKRSGSYYEAIIQVRGFEGALDREHAERIRDEVETAVAAESRRERGVFLTKAEDVQGGLDFYVSSTQAAQRIAVGLREVLGATLLKSGKISGVKDGAELQRTTFSVRLPKFIRNDVLLHEERVFRVSKVHPRSIAVVDLETGVVQNKQEDFLKHAAVGGKEATRLEAVVVSATREDIQVLDPVSFATVTLTNWPRHEPGTDKVEVIRWRGRLFLSG